MTSSRTCCEPDPAAFTTDVFDPRALLPPVLCYLLSTLIFSAIQDLSSAVDKDSRYPLGFKDVRNHSTPRLSDTVGKLSGDPFDLWVSWLSGVADTLGEIVGADAEIIDTIHCKNLVDVVDGALVFEQRAYQHIVVAVLVVGLQVWDVMPIIGASICSKGALSLGPKVTCVHQSLGVFFGCYVWSINSLYTSVQEAQDSRCVYVRHSSNGGHAGCVRRSAYVLDIFQGEGPMLAIQPDEVEIQHSQDLYHVWRWEYEVEAVGHPAFLHGSYYTIILFHFFCISLDRQ